MERGNAMATNGNRWLKERGGKNPLDRIKDQKTAANRSADALSIEPGTSWVHKLTALSFLVEDVDEELVLLSPIDENAATLEVTPDQFRELFVHSDAYKGPKTRKTKKTRKSKKARVPSWR
jgi:hypothetical protein